MLLAFSAFKKDLFRQSLIIYLWWKTKSIAEKLQIRSLRISTKFLVFNYIYLNLRFFLIQIYFNFDTYVINFIILNFSILTLHGFVFGDLKNFRFE